jgi:hypothetical protein
MSDTGSGKVNMFAKAAVQLNGISIAYIMALVNAVLACLLAFGVSLTDQEIAAIVGLVNAAMALAIHIGHRVGEATASGASGGTSRARMDTLQVAAERRGLELHDAQPQPATPGPDQVSGG